MKPCIDHVTLSTCFQSKEAMTCKVQTQMRRLNKCEYKLSNTQQKSIQSQDNINKVPRTFIHLWIIEITIQTCSLTAAYTQGFNLLLILINRLQTLQTYRLFKTEKSQEGNSTKSALRAFDYVKLVFDDKEPYCSIVKGCELLLTCNSSSSILMWIL